MDVILLWLAFPILIKDDAPFSRREFQIYLEERDIQTRVVFTGNITRQPMCSNIKKLLLMKVTLMLMPLWKEGYYCLCTMV